MSDPTRLREGGSEPMRALLASAETDDPNDAQLRDLDVRLAPLLVPPGGGSLPPAGGGAALAKTGLAMKGLAMLALATAVGGGAVIAHRYAQKPTVEAGATSSTLAPPAPVPTAESETPPAESAAPAVETASPSAPSAPPAPVTSADPGLEPDLVKRAQTELAGGNAAGALDLAQQHARLFPGGAHTEERERIAIEALVRVGRGGEAHARADRFFARYPRSVYRPRLEAMLGKR